MSLRSPPVRVLSLKPRAVCPLQACLISFRCLVLHVANLPWCIKSWGNSPGQQVKRGSSLIFSVCWFVSFPDVIIAEFISGVFVTKTRGRFVTGRDVLISFI